MLAHNCLHFEPFFDAFTEFCVKPRVLHILIRFFFQWKLRWRFSWKSIRGTIRGTTRSPISLWNYQNFLIFSFLKISLIQNIILGGPPYGPPCINLKNTTSQLSLEKKIIKLSFLDQFLSKSEKSPSKHTENHDSGVPTRNLRSCCLLKIKI